MSRKRNRQRGVVTVNGALTTLLNATGAILFLDASYGVTKNGSNQCASLLSRIGTYTVEQATDALKPVHGGVTSPTGKAGLAFVAASSQRLSAPDSVLAGILDGSQAYSALCVFRQGSTGSNRACWGAGSTTTNHSIYEGVSSTGGERCRRFDAAATQNDGSALGTAIALKTSVYTGSAYSTWLNGTASLAASANTRAPTCDNFTLGGFMATGALSGFWDGDFYALIIALSQWSAAERQSYEVAAKAIWGTP